MNLVGKGEDANNVQDMALDLLSGQLNEMEDANDIQDMAFELSSGQLNEMEDANNVQDMAFELLSGQSYKMEDANNVQDMAFELLSGQLNETKDVDREKGLKVLPTAPLSDGEIEPVDLAVIDGMFSLDPDPIDAKMEEVKSKGQIANEIGKKTITAIADDDKLPFAIKNDEFLYLTEKSLPKIDPIILKHPEESYYRNEYVYESELSQKRSNELMIQTSDNNSIRKLAGDKNDNFWESSEDQNVNLGKACEMQKHEVTNI